MKRQCLEMDIGYKTNVSSGQWPVEGQPEGGAVWVGPSVAGWDLL